MKIINLQEFMKLPSGTVFCKYKPCVFGDICIKGDWVTDTDFVYASLTGEIDCTGSNDMIDKLFKYEKTGESFNLDLDAYTRDGLYEKNQLFAVYEKRDIAQLVKKLEELL